MPLSATGSAPRSAAGLEGLKAGFPRGRPAFAFLRCSRVVVLRLLTVVAIAGCSTAGPSVDPDAVATRAPHAVATRASQTLAPDTPAPARRAELLHLLKQDCGACHGLTMKGGLGSPLTAEALRERDDESLVSTILRGRPGTAMPPWSGFMNEAEARWLVHVLKQRSRTPL